MKTKRTHITADVEKHIQQLELHTRRLLNHTHNGQTRSMVKGTGFDFDQIREYQLGDDVRFIDWKASARSHRMLVKQYRQEQGRNVLIALDTSRSMALGSDTYDKARVQADLGSLVALASAYADDAVGLILFSDTIETYIPPIRNRHAGRIIMEKIFSSKSKGERTNFSALCQHLVSLRKKNGLLLIISDFIDEGRERDFSLIGRLYDTIAIRCLMPHERHIETGSFVMMRDAEWGTEHLIDVRGSQGRRINEFLKQRIEDQNKFFTRNGIDIFDVSTGLEHTAALVSFFYQRKLSF